ncbi:hypothetical protein SAMN04488554_3393 [Ruania alba]|uniref:Uncharacterized protein n=1 Tax=Ruania alba TaxID=648782 RepID=A0A1H5MHA8_9MICO|nr:hypothetical protein SAMN04488554_3393 [Ruania alba]
MDSKRRLMVTAVNSGQSQSALARHGGTLHHIGIGRTHARTPVVLLIADLDITIINAATGEILRQLILGPTRDYQPTGRPPGPAHTRNDNGPTFP